MGIRIENTMLKECVLIAIIEKVELKNLINADTLNYMLKDIAKTAILIDIINKGGMLMKSLIIVVNKKIQ